MPIKKRKIATQKLKVQKTRKIQKTAKTVIEKGGGLRVDVYNTKGKVVGKISLPKEIFAAKINEKLMAQAVRVYLANQRQGTASTKTRGEVAGSTRKVYRQKGTGRARHGSVRAPIYVHGGIAFGPKPRDFSLQLPKKMRRLALFSALSMKARDKALYIIDGLEKIEPKTKNVTDVLKRLQMSEKEKILLILSKQSDSIKRAARNIEKLDILPTQLINTYEVLAHPKLIVIKEALPEMEKIWKQES